MKILEGSRVRVKGPRRGACTRSYLTILLGRIDPHRGDFLLNLLIQTGMEGSALW